MSVPGVYGGFIDKIPMGAVMNKGADHPDGPARTCSDTCRAAAGAHRRRARSTRRFVITHRLTLEEAPQGYEMFKHKDDGCVRVAFDPRLAAG